MNPHPIDDLWRTICDRGAEGCNHPLTTEETREC